MQPTNTQKSGSTLFSDIRAKKPVGRPRKKNTEQSPSKRVIFWLQFSAYAIPLAFLLYVLYWNFLPFGYNKTFTIDVGSANDTSGEFYLLPSRDLSERKTAPDGTTYRELNGTVYAIFKPEAVLKNAQITVSVEGEVVSIIPPVIDFNPDSVEWDYKWDFTQGKTPEELGLVGNAFPFDGAMYFDGKSRLELPDSADKFEDGPFSVYVEWTPEDAESDNQQIVGHFNWEIWQNNDSVEFRVGRMNRENGPAYSIKHPIDQSFFNASHKILAIYNPADRGYIELFIDNNHIGRTYIDTDIIWNDYGSQNLSMGWTSHNYESSPYLRGSIKKVNFLTKGVLTEFKKVTLGKYPLSNNTISVNALNGSLMSIKLHAIKK